MVVVPEPEMASCLTNFMPSRSHERSAKLLCGDDREA
jgi:hypothetical protein